MTHYRITLEEHGTQRRITKSVTADSQREACAIALRSQPGAWFVRVAYNRGPA